MVSYILGTAGHIDHGKSALIRALTGIDPDRLPEEKRRGVTIELGFAQLALPDGTLLGVVDVPGHEKFVRQMVAGASGVDIALLVVAADDGVMVQTREHIRVLQLMGVTHLVVALSKCDLVDAEWRNLVALEIEELLEAHGYHDVPIVETSVTDGTGLDELVATIQATVATIQAKAGADVMRLPVDRVFTIEGAGCVVTGTLWSGVAKTGDTVEVVASRRTARIRTIQVHGIESPRAQAGQRVALNLAGIATDDIVRGDTVATPNSIQMTDRFDVALTYLGGEEGGLSEIPGALKSGTRVHVHHAATTTLGRVYLLEGAPLAAGHEAFAQIRLETPIAAHYGDRFIIRSYSPTYTIGGGVILMISPHRQAKLGPADREILVALQERNLAAVVRGVMTLGGAPTTSAELAYRLGVTRSEVAALLNSSDYERIKIASETWFVTAEGAQRIRDRIEKTLLAFHESNPDRIDMSIATLREQATGSLSGELFVAFIDRLVSDARIVADAGRARHLHAPQAAMVEQQRLAAAALPRLEAQGLTPEMLTDLAGALGCDPKTLARALAPLVDDGRLVRLAGDLYFSPAAIEQGAQRIRAFFAHGPVASASAPGSGAVSSSENTVTVDEVPTGATAAQLRDVLGISRKYAIPLLEYYDRTALTRREGDLRFLRQAPTR